jgi:hypothetical protein
LRNAGDDAEFRAEAAGEAVAGFDAGGVAGGLAGASERRFDGLADAFMLGTICTNAVAISIAMLCLPDGGARCGQVCG